MCTAAMQENLPNFLTDTSNTKVVLPNGIERRGANYKEPGGPQPIRNAADIPLGDGLAQGAALALKTRRERIAEALGE
ncbi:MAG: hypothetical protein ACYS7Y_35815 [Planctomycetota bacterium]